MLWFSRATSKTWFTSKSMPKLSYSCSVRNSRIFGMVNWVLCCRKGICCCTACMMSCAIFASSVCGLTTKGEIPRSSTSSIRFPRLPSKSRTDSILLTLTRNIVYSRLIRIIHIRDLSC